VGMSLKFLIISFLIVGLVAASNPDKVVLLKKADTNITVDGVIEPAWNKADSTDGFFQATPYYGQEPSKRTVAKLLTSEESLYCLVICYDDSRNIEQKKGKLDDFGGDVVSLMIDTYSDERTAYKFGVTAAGVKSDCRLLDDARNRDYSWDGIWFSQAKVYDWGYVVEMQIPYKSIQYDESLNAWGLDFDRWVALKSEDQYWCPFEESEGQRVSRFGQLQFEDFRPSVQGLNLELYPVAISKAIYVDEKNYDTDFDIGFNAFYNPSPKLTFLLTVNPDFAQIEADPFDFNISRYESYFSERRPFFTEGNEVFMPSGKLRNSGFYRPLELFYSRRIGKKLPDGQEVPLILGSKVFGRLGDLEYGGFVAMTAETDHLDEDDVERTESRAVFTSGRIKRQIFGNSSIGLLYVGKHTPDNTFGVFDIDGAFRTSSWQLSYQFASSFDRFTTGYAAAAGFTMIGDSWLTFLRGNVIEKTFDVADQISYVPWKGTKEFTGLSGPRWYFDQGYIKSILIYAGPFLFYETDDHFTDYGALFGFNMQLRDNWGFEINLVGGEALDEGVHYNYYDATFSSWFNTSPKWNGKFFGKYAWGYNFSREYLAFYTRLGGGLDWQILDEIRIGTSINVHIEGNPANNIEEITYNTRPYLSWTPVNDLNIRLYVDNVFLNTTGKIEQSIAGFLIAYNYSPKSWIYFAVNEFRQRDDFNIMRISDRAAVLKASYLYYF
jgi:hypothetical protein